MSRPLRTKRNEESLLKMGIPRKFTSATLDDFIEYPEVKEVKLFVNSYIHTLDYNIRHGMGISFFGSNGVGKTMLSCIILAEAYMQRFRGRRITLSDYINLVTNTWKDSEDDSFDEYMSAEILVLEELGKEIDSKIAKPILESLLRFREEHSLATIICSNMTLENFKDFYGNSICSLINGNSTVITIDAEDRR